MIEDQFIADNAKMTTGEDIVYVCDHCSGLTVDVTKHLEQAHGITPPPAEEKKPDSLITDALVAAESVLSLLKWRGIKETENNREDVDRALSLLQTVLYGKR